MKHFTLTKWIVLILMVAFVASCGRSSSKAPTTPNPVPPSVTMTALSVLPTIKDFASAESISKGGVVQFNAKAYYSDGSSKTVTDATTFTSSDSSILAFNINASPNSATALKIGGPVNVKATFLGVDKTISYSVSEAVPVSISISPAQLPNGLAVGTELAFSAVYVLSDQTTVDATKDVNWSSTNAGALDIKNDGENKGTATAIAAGDASVKADKGILNSPSIAVKVFMPTEAPTLVLEPSNPKILPSGRLQSFKAYLKYSSERVVEVTSRVDWNSSSDSIASFAENLPKGYLIADSTNTGNATISAQDSVSGVQSSNVEVKVENIAISTIQMTPIEDYSKPLPSNTSRQLGIIATYSDNIARDITQTVDWSTEEGSYLAVTNELGNKGKVSTLRAREEGAKIASVKVTDPISEQSVSVTIDSEGRKLERLEIGPLITQKIPAGYNGQFTASAVFTDGSVDPYTEEVTWTTSNSEVVSIDNSSLNKGKASALKKGHAVLSAKYNVEGLVITSNPITIEVTDATLESMAIEPSTDIDLDLGASVQLVAKGTFSDGTTREITQSVNWKSSDRKVATVTAKGKVSAIAVGDPITINAFDPQAHVIASKQITVTGKVKEHISITTNETVMKPVGVSHTYEADFIFEDGKVEPVSERVQWEVSDSTIAIISNEPMSKGKIIGLKEGTVNVTAKYQDLVSSSVIFEVTAAEIQSIQVTPNQPLGMKIGDTVQFSAMGVMTDNSEVDLSNQVTWSSEMTNVASISNSADHKGILVAKGAGLTNITARKGNIISNHTEVVVSDDGQQDKATLTITSEQGGSVVSSPDYDISCSSAMVCTYELNIGEVITLYSAADAGFEFKGWDSCDSSNGTTCIMTIDNPSENVKAEFDKK